MNRYESDHAPLNPEGPLCRLFADRDLVRQCMEIRDPNRPGEQPAFQELKKLYRDTYPFRESREIPGIVDQVLHVFDDPALRTRCTFKEEMVPGFNCISLHQSVFELLRSEHGDLLEAMKPVMRLDATTEKSYIDEARVPEFLEGHREVLSRFEPQLVALYFGSFAFLHEHRGRESEILDPLLDWGSPYPEYFDAMMIATT